NVKCAASQVCSGSACSASCLPGLTNCSGACVDTNNDDNHCGSCANACPAGDGCVGGKCVPVLTLTRDAGPSCVGGGPPIDAGAGAGCTGTLGQVAFTWALCSCTNLDISAPLTTDGYDSTKGPPDGGLGGNIGVNQRTPNWSSRVSVGGDFRSSGSQSIGV